MATLLVIGASRGIGLETVRQALAAGHRVRAFARGAASIPIEAPALEKIGRVRMLIDQAPQPIHLVVDGGVEPETALDAVAAGADVLVAGTAVFGQPDWAAAIQALRRA